MVMLGSKQRVDFCSSLWGAPLGAGFCGVCSCLWGVPSSTIQIDMSSCPCSLPRPFEIVSKMVAYIFSLFQGFCEKTS